MLARFVRLFSPSTRVSSAIRQLSVYQPFLETDIRLKYLPENSTALTLAILLGKEFTPFQFHIASKFAEEIDKHLGNKNELLTKAIKDVLVQKGLMKPDVSIGEITQSLYTISCLAYAVYLVATSDKAKQMAAKGKQTAQITSQIASQTASNVKNYLSDLWQSLPSEEELKTNPENQTLYYHRF